MDEKSPASEEAGYNKSGAAACKEKVSGARMLL
jgi:hypothetical protein